MKNKKRLITQIFFLLVVGFIATNHYLAETGQELPFIAAESLHAICPFGGVETLVSLFMYGVYVNKIHASSVILLGIILVMSVILGPVVCSYICPLGSIQEWIGKLGKKIFKKRYNTFIPRKLDIGLRYMRYVVLVMVVFMTTRSLQLLFLEVDPYYALFNFWSSEATIGGIIVLVIVLLSSLFVERPWCKYACPFGAVVGLSNFFSIFKIKRNASTCISCNKCTSECPMNIDVARKSVVKNHQCIRCGICTSENQCPIPKTVELRIQSFKGEE